MTHSKMEQNKKGTKVIHAIYLMGRMENIWGKRLLAVQAKMVVNKKLPFHE